MKEYLLLNNILANLENRSDYLMLNEFANLTPKVFCPNEYRKTISVIAKFLQKEELENVRLIIGSYYMRLPCFIDILKRKLNGIDIVTLFQIACNQYNIRGDFSFNEIYDDFTITTLYKNKEAELPKQQGISILTDHIPIGDGFVEIYTQQIINHSIRSSVLLKLEPYFSDSITDIQKKDFISFEGINNINSSLQYDNYEKDDLIHVNFSDWDFSKDIIKDKNFTVDSFYKIITETLCEFSPINDLVGFKNLIFSPLLFFQHIGYYLQNCNVKYIDLEQCSQKNKSIVNILRADFLIQTEPDVVFTDEQSLWIASELSTEISVSKKNENGEYISRFSFSDESLINNTIQVGNLSIVNFLLHAKSDIFNNLHLHLKFSDNKSILNLIEFKV